MTNCRLIIFHKEGEKLARKLLLPIYIENSPNITLSELRLARISMPLNILVDEERLFKTIHPDP